MARELRQNVSSLETTLSAALAVLATASGYWTYMGVRGLLDGDGVLAVGGALIYSIAVSVGIYVFWTFMLRFMPLLRERGFRAAMWAAMAVGCVAILAMSSWLNAAALAGSGAIEQHLARTVEEYQQRLELSHENALAAQALVPDLEREAERFRLLAEKERDGGALTGSSGSGTVVQLLSQKSVELRTLAQQIRNSRQDVDRLYELGGQKLGTLRELVSAAGDIQDRSVRFAREAVSLVGVIADMQQTSLAPSVRRAALDMKDSFIAPSPSGGDSALGVAQNEVIAEIEQAISATSAQLAAAAEEIIEQPRAEPYRFVPLSAAEAVIRYAGDFVPSWAGAIAIDLMPAVLVFILMVVQAAIRQHDGQTDAAWRVSAGDMAMALTALERLESLRAAPAPASDEGGAERPATAAAPAEEARPPGPEPIARPKAVS